MTSTSSDPMILRGSQGDALVAGARPDLRRGEWTRLGGSSFLGDPVTEAALADLTERSRAAARAQGYAAGWAEGRRKALVDAEAETARRAAVADTAAVEGRRVQQSLVSALSEAVARCGEDLSARQADLTDLAVELALHIAEAVLQREVTLAADAGADALRRALADVPLTASATVRLNPADLAALDRSTIADRPLRLVADDAVARGDALVETETSSIDATVPAALERVRKVLGR